MTFDEWLAGKHPVAPLIAASMEEWWEAGRAEIAKRDARIKELETNINAFAREQAQKMLNNGTYSDKVNQQAAEISRLREVLAKIGETLQFMWRDVPMNDYAFSVMEEALTAIKEIEHGKPL